MRLTSIEQVERIVGSPTGPRDIKVIDFIDEHAQRWLSHTTLAFLAFANTGDIQLTVASGTAGFTHSNDPNTLLIPLSAMDGVSLCTTGASFGALFIVSGMEETLRINGGVTGVEDGNAVIRVEECYLHCAKSFRRSEFWQPASPGGTAADAGAFLGRARFMVIATINSKGQADVSPKGDPAGLLLQQDGDTVCFPDRPGNKRIDGFRNIIEKSCVDIVALIPGCEEILQISGTAEIHTDETLSNRFEVQGKAPKIVTKVAPGTMQIKPSPAMARSRPWPPTPPPEALDASEIFKAHIKQSKERSLQAKVARAALSVPGAMKKGLDYDYKKNMY